MNTRPFGVGWYSLAPTILATAERVPSAPTTTGALSSPAAVVTPATRPRSITSPVTAVWVLTSAPAAAAALTRISSSVIRRTLRTGAPVIPGTSSTTAKASSKILRTRILGGATFSSASRTPMRSSTWTPAGWIACVDSVSLGKRSLSTTQTRRPARASIAASGAPAQRAPTTMTSKDSPHALTRRTVSVLHRFRADAIALRSEECWLSLRATDWPAALGGLMVVVGVGVLLHAFGRFVVEGRGTPAPIAPTERLVVGGLYRHVRNPMYVAVGMTIVGQALLLGRPLLLAYAAVFWLVVASFVRGYEEPTLRARYGEEYAAYRRAVPGWWPRLRPWSPQPPRR